MNYERYIYLTLSLLWAVFIGGMTWCIAKHFFDIKISAISGERRSERRLPLLFRLLLPLRPCVFPLIRKPIFSGLKTRVSRKLTAGGFDDIISPEEFLALRILFPLISTPILFIFVITACSLFLGKADSGTGIRLVGLVGAIILFTIMYPHWWLKKGIALRHKLILKALPFVIDLLTLSVEAGLDFMSAINNILSRRAMDPIGEELNHVIIEIQLGKTRREALKNMANRIDLADIHSLVTALVQADEMGVSIGAILRIQSGQIRTKRFVRAETLANEAPVKMLFPLVACIFPAVFLILLGPIILQIVNQGF